MPDEAKVWAVEAPIPARVSGGGFGGMFGNTGCCAGDECCALDLVRHSGLCSVEGS